MSNIDKDIVKDFVIESKGIIQDLVDLLEGIEGDFSQVLQLEEYGQKGIFNNNKTFKELTELML